MDRTMKKVIYEFRIVLNFSLREQGIQDNGISIIIHAIHCLTTPLIALQRGTLRSYSNASKNTPFIENPLPTFHGYIHKLSFHFRRW